MLAEYITSLADVSFHTVATMYVRFRNLVPRVSHLTVPWSGAVR